MPTPNAATATISSSHTAAGTACNTANGLCEWCGASDPTEACTASQCCNYSGTFWYCGTCCVPPCGDGQACKGGTCVDLKCPTCDADQECGADFTCHDVAADGDQDQEARAAICLPANSTCSAGGTLCCSGTCLMGTCL